jgi:hypothetical protein
MGIELLPSPSWSKRNMMVNLTPAQLCSLPDPALNLLGRLLAEQPRGATLQARAPEHGNRRSLGRHLSLLQDLGIITVESPGKWCRNSYRLQLADNKFAQWFAGSAASKRWPHIYPDVYETLRQERPGLDQEDFDRRFTTGLLEAVTRPDTPRSIVAWLRRALTFPCPPAEPIPQASTPMGNQPSARDIAQLHRQCPGYDAVVNRRPPTKE